MVRLSGKCSLPSMRTVDSTNGRLDASCHHLRSVCRGLLTVLGSSFFDAAAAALALDAGLGPSLSFESFARSFACFTGTKSLSFFAVGSSFRRSPPKAVLLFDKSPIAKQGRSTYPATSLGTKWDRTRVARCMAAGKKRLAANRITQNRRK